MLARLLILLITLLCSACQHADDKQAHVSQGVLDEADLLMASRYFDQASQTANSVIPTLTELVTKHPENTDIQLLLVRAHLLTFLAENALLIDQSPPRTQSLIRIPRMNEYKDYDTHVKPALDTLIKLANSDTKFSFEQQAFIYGNIAAIFRLSPDTAERSVTEYDKAIAAYRSWRQELEAPKSKIQSNKYALERIDNQIRAMLMAQAEAGLLAEEWSKCLDSLQSAAGGTDLQFFTVHFGQLEQRKAVLETKVRNEEASGDSQPKRLLSMAKQRAKQSGNKRDEIASYSPYQAELIFTRAELNDLQNNLAYRIICLHRLNRIQERDAARTTLRAFYPDMEAKVSAALQIQENKR
ncbi:MAG: hypothetical protein KDK78_04715 [Chlamydiia bacterium]|nr:hypothetical protein [Chlamydiia bacterium]